MDDNQTEASLRAKALALSENPTAAPGMTTTPAILGAAADLIRDRRAAKATADAAAAAATTAKNAALEEARELLTDYSNEVWKASGKNVEKVQLLDFNVRDDNAPPPPPNSGQMTNLSLKAGPNPGSLILKADPMERKIAIDCQVNTTPNLNPTWIPQAPFSATPYTLNDLPSGAMVQVRIRAVFAGGQLGPWSDIAELRVP